jgi:hypothetical protein
MKKIVVGIHPVTLSNGQIVVLIERNNELSIAFDDGELTYIASIDPSGVLVMPNSGGATAYLTQGLKGTEEDV